LTIHEYLREKQYFCPDTRKYHFQNAMLFRVFPCNRHEGRVGEWAWEKKAQKMNFSAALIQK
jgi:hypothetical protein